MKIAFGTKAHSYQKNPKNKKQCCSLYPSTDANFQSAHLNSFLYQDAI